MAQDRFTHVLDIIFLAITTFQATEIHLQTLQDWNSLHFTVMWDTSGLLIRPHMLDFCSLNEEEEIDKCISKISVCEVKVEGSTWFSFSKLDLTLSFFFLSSHF